MSKWTNGENERVNLSPKDSMTWLAMVLFYGPVAVLAVVAICWLLGVEIIVRPAG